MAAIDLNSADEQSLVGLKGIGPAKARAIVEERKRNGPFKSLDDVHARVKGIGPLTIAQWKKDGSASTTGRAEVARGRPRDWVKSSFLVLRASRFAQGSIAMSAVLASAQPLKLRPLMPGFGAEVLDLDLHRITDQEFEQVYAAWLKYHVLLFRGQNQLTNQSFEDFSRRLGELDPPPNQGAGRKNVPGYPMLYVVSNGQSSAGDRGAPGRRRGDLAYRPSSAPAAGRFHAVVAEDSRERRTQSLRWPTRSKPRLADVVLWDKK